MTNSQSSRSSMKFHHQQAAKPSQTSFVTTAHYSESLKRSTPTTVPSTLDNPSENSVTSGESNTTSSPTHSRSNGFIERQIGYVKPLLEKSIRNSQDIYLTLLNIRATPINAKLRSPTELLLGELIITLLPSHRTVGEESVRDELHQAQERMMNHDDHSTKKFELPPLIAGQQVRVLSHKNHRLFPGTVIDVDSSNPRSYSINTNG